MAIQPSNSNLCRRHNINFSEPAGTVQCSGLLYSNAYSYQCSRFRWRDKDKLYFSISTPSSKFHADNINPALGQTVNFTDLSTGNLISWVWTFEGGNPSSWNGQNPPAIQYLNSGAWDVTLIVSNGTINDVELKTDYITVSEFVASTATLSLPNVSATAAGEIAVPLRLDAISSNLIVGIQISFYYDPTYITWMGSSTTPDDGISYINPAFTPLGGDWLWNSLTGNLVFFMDRPHI